QNDLLEGGAGNDTLSGGAGDDAYLYNAGDGADVIEDESGTSDILVLGNGITPQDIEITKSLDSLHIQIGAAEAGNSIDMQGVDSLLFSNGTYWNAVQIDDHTVGNRAPRVGQGMANQVAAAGSPFSFTIPVAAFQDPDPGTSLAYVAQLANGDPLPGWLSFDATTRTFSGTPAASDLATLSLRVSAYDPDNVGVSSDFAIDVINSIMVGTDFIERIDGTPFADLIDGRGAGDILIGYAGNDTIYGGAGNDSIEGGAGDDHLEGGEGNDYLTGEAGADTLVGGEGSDTYQIDFNNGTDVISDSGGFQDEISLTQGNHIQDFSFSREGDALRASLNGSPGNDFVIKGWFSDPANQIEAWVTPGLNYWTSSDINAQLNLNVAPTLAYTMGDLNVVADQQFTYVVPSIVFRDANTSDTLTYAARLADGNVLPSWLQFDAQTRTFQGTAPGGFDSSLSVRLRATDAGGLFAEDEFTIWVGLTSVNGSSAGGVIMGGAGAEEIKGRAGIDEMHGGGGADTLIGGRGDDRLFGGEGNDTFVFSRGDDHDVISIAENPAGDADTLTFTDSIDPYLVRR